MRFHRKKKTLAVVVLALLLAAIVFLAWPSNPASAPGSTSSKSTAATTTAFDKHLYSTDEASSLWAVVNKGRELPSSYVPANLVAPNVPLRYSSASTEMHVRSDTAAALEKMFADAKQQGINLMLVSGYRSYGLQADVYASYAKSSGVTTADTFSARPGHSEHQTGLAADLGAASGTCQLDQCFGDTPEGKWLAANAYRFGFIIRYPKGDQSLTGYEYEPWHVRYVGEGLAAQIHTTGQTLEQFFGLPTYSNYPSSSFMLKS